MSTIGFGSKRDADRVTARVRAMHRRVRGRLKQRVGPYPAGTPYRADDPELLMWVLFTLVDSATRRLPQVRRAALTATRRPRCGRTTGSSGGCSACATATCRATLADLDDYRREMLDGTACTSATGRASAPARSCSSRRCRWPARPLLETVNFITIALLPDQIRAQYGFSPLPPASCGRRSWRAAPEYVRRAVLPVLPNRLRLRPA